MVDDGFSSGKLMTGVTVGWVFIDWSNTTVMVIVPVEASASLITGEEDVTETIEGAMMLISSSLEEVSLDVFPAASVEVTVTSLKPSVSGL